MASPFLHTTRRCGERQKDSAAHRYQQAAAALAARVFLPAAGYRNGSDVNNEGSNGNYWSASLNENNPNNARNLNFNSENANWNNNNRNNGFTVRPVLSTCHSSKKPNWQCILFYCS